MALIKVPVYINHQGRTAVVTGLVDTGADVTVLVDRSVADQLGIKSSPGADPTPYTGVGGKLQLGFNAKLDQVGIRTVPECALAHPVVTIGELGFREIKLLLGGKFLQRTMTNIAYRADGGVDLACRGGPAVYHPEETPILYYVLGGAAALAILLLLIGR